MLQRAIKYKSQIEDFINDLSNEDYLKYWFHSTRCHNGEIKIEGDEWSHIHRVSMSEDGKTVYGYFHIVVDRETGIADSFSILNMIKAPHPTLARDLFQFLDNLLNKYQFRKLSFFVSIGNPAEKQYDRIINKLGGSIVGIKEKDVKLLDGNYYDVKQYEIMGYKYINPYRKKRSLSESEVDQLLDRMGMGGNK